MSANEPAQAVTKNSASLTLGIIATVLGVLCLLIGWVPYLGLFTLPAALLGLLLAGVGLLLALFKRLNGIALPAIGAVLCLAAIALPIAMTSVTANAIDEANRQRAVDRAATTAR